MGTRRVKRTKKARSRRSQRGGMMTDQEFGLKMMRFQEINKEFKRVFMDKFSEIAFNEHIPEEYRIRYANALAFLQGAKKTGSELELKAQEIKREIEDLIELSMSKKSRNANNENWLRRAEKRNKNRNEW